jgi:DNA-binding response OmpR family regulator
MDKTNKAILLVDDDVGILTACAESLLLDGYQVDVADCGEKALEMIPKKKYHLIVTDLMMGEVDGLQVLQFTKEFSPFSEVMVLTAHGSVSTAVEAMKMGAYDYLPKPFDPYRLDTAVRRALEHQTLLRELSGLKEILHLYDATKTLSNIREEKELLQMISKYAGEIADADGASILIITPDHKQFTISATHGVRHGILLNQKINISKDKLDAMQLDELKTLDTMDVRKYFQLEHLPGFADITSSLSVPIFYKDRLLAVLNLCRVGTQKPHFSEEELRLITILSAQVGYALENARLFESLHAQSRQDAFSRLQDACERMFARPEFQNLPLAEKNQLEEIMGQCRLLAEKNGGKNKPRRKGEVLFSNRSVSPAKKSRFLPSKNPANSLRF